MIQEKKMLYAVSWELKPVNLVERRDWNMFLVREMCINHELFTAGTNDEYVAMLEFVSENEPTAENIFWVAQNIYRHSDKTRQTISNIMYLLAKEACYTTFELGSRTEF